MKKCKELEYDRSGAARYLGCSAANITKHINKGHLRTVWRGHLGAKGSEMILHSELLRFKHSKHWQGKDESNE